MKEHHTLIFEDSRGNKKEIAHINDLDDMGNPKSEQNILDEAGALISSFCTERNFKINYSRMWNTDSETVFDVGSHTEFFYLTPEVKLYDSNRK